MAIDWQSPHVLHICATIFDKLVQITFGIYCWHFLTTLRYVEFRLIDRSLKWRWAYLYYFGGRYLVLVSQIIEQFPMSEGVFEAIVIVGSIGIICCSGNLLLRTMTLWRQSRLVVVLLGLAGLGQWAIMFAVTAVPIATQDPGFAPGMAGPGQGHSGSSLPFYFYTFLFDFLILVFTIWGLYRQRAAHDSALWRTLYRQGILYFVATLLVNVPLLVLGWLDLNVFMSGMFASPNLIVSVIASSGAVMSLLSLKDTVPHTDLIQTRMQPPGLTNLTSQRLSTHITFSGSLDDDFGDNATDFVHFKREAV